MPACEAAARQELASQLAADGVSESQVARLSINGAAWPREGLDSWACKLEFSDRAVQVATAGVTMVVTKTRATEVLLTITDRVLAVSAAGAMKP